MHVRERPGPRCSRRSLLAALIAASITAQAGAETASGVRGTVTYQGKTAEVVAGYAFPGLDDGSGNPPPVLFLVGTPLDAKKIAAKPHAGARTVNVGEQAKAKKTPLLFIWVENPGEVMVRYIDDGDLFSEDRTEFPPTATLATEPWGAPADGRLRGRLSSESTTFLEEGLSFDVTFDVELLQAK
jgi:hypothetical protein